MIFTKSLSYQLLLTTLALCCLSSSVWAGKLPKSQTTVNATTTEIGSTAFKAEIATTEATSTLSKKTKSKPTKEEEDDDDDNEDDDDEEDDDDKADDDDDAAEKDPAEKNAVQPAAETSLSVWGMVRSFWNWIREDISEGLFGDDDVKTSAVTGRTFGKIRRLQMALIPIIFKFGVLSALVAFLVAIGMKTLFLVKVLVVMNLLAILGKFFTLKANFGNFGHYGHIEHAAPAPSWGWTPYASSSGWQSAAPVEQHTNKEIHLHIHGGAQVQPQAGSYSYGHSASGSSAGWERRNDPYSAYEAVPIQAQASDLVSEEVSGTDNAPASSQPQPQRIAQPQFISNGQQYTSFPSNHRMI